MTLILGKGTGTVQCLYCKKVIEEGEAIQPLLFGRLAHKGCERPKK